jgi:predicted GIY-YIG superfamily endonuclease
MSRWCVYIIEKSGRYYTGITTDLANRLRQHGAEKALYIAGGLDRT